MFGRFRCLWMIQNLFHFNYSIASHSLWTQDARQCHLVQRIVLRMLMVRILFEVFVTVVVIMPCSLPQSTCHQWLRVKQRGRSHFHCICIYSSYLNEWWDIGVGPTVSGLVSLFHHSQNLTKLRKIGVISSFVFSLLQPCPKQYDDEDCVCTEDSTTSPASHRIETEEWAQVCPVGIVLFLCSGQLVPASSWQQGYVLTFWEPFLLVYRLALDDSNPITNKVTFGLCVKWSLVALHVAVSVASEKTPPNLFTMVSDSEWRGRRNSTRNPSVHWATLARDMSHMAQSYSTESVHQQQVHPFAIVLH